MQKFVIYAITRIGTEDAYIGSSIDVRNRWKKHRSDLRKGNHHCAGLMRVWLEFGPEAFSFEVLANYEVETVNERAAIELQWIISKGTLNAINDHVDLHNLYPMSEANKTLKSAEIRAKIATNQKYAEFLSLRGKAIADYMKSPEGRLLMKEHTKRRWQDPEERIRLQAGLIRTQQDPEVEKRRAANISKAHSTPEMKAFHKANAQKMLQNPDLVAKMAKGSRDYWANPEARAKRSEKMKEIHAKRRAAKATEDS